MIKFNIKFNKGAPPSVGWWPATLSPYSYDRVENLPIRWWNGKRWSEFAQKYDTNQAAGERAANTLNSYMSSKVVWAKRWWE